MSRLRSLRELTNLELDELAREFHSASPCRHVVIEGVLTSPDEAAAAFPSANWTGWTEFNDDYQRLKRFSAEVGSFPAPLGTIFHELAAPETLRNLERITGIQGLIPDPYLDGGGIHLSLPGGILAPHTDFHVYSRLGLYRRINLIIYLNERWDDPGGSLEFYADRNATRVAASIVPELGRCVIFETDDRSVHGFTRSVPQGRERRSIAVYYYTSADTERFAGDTTSVWRRGDRLEGISHLRDVTARALVALSQRVSQAAYRIDPHRRAPRARQ